MSTQVLADLDFNASSRIVNLPDPVAAQQPATKAYVDSAVEGLAWKDSARVATQGNINLASPGATIDAVTMAVNDRVLVRAQTAQAENGIYIWNGAAVPMTRAPDANTAAELEQAVVTVEEGTSAATSFRQTQVNFTLGTSNVLFVNFGASAPPASTTTAGIIEIATQAEVDTGTAADLAVTPQTLANWAGRLRRVAATFGDGAATQFTVTHNLNTEDVQVQIRRTTGAKDFVLADIEVLSVNAVRVTFAAAPALNAFRAIVIG